MKIKSITLMSLLLLSACGNHGPRGVTGPSGNDGAPGQDGKDGSIIDVVRLCPDIPGTYPEVLLRIDGKLYAVLDGGASTDRLVEIIPGPSSGFYRTTDGRNCEFYVTPEYEVVEN